MSKHDYKTSINLLGYYVDILVSYDFTDSINRSLENPYEPANVTINNVEILDIDDLSEEAKKAFIFDVEKNMDIQSITLNQREEELIENAQYEMCGNDDY